MESYVEVKHPIAEADLEPKDISEDIQPLPLRRHPVRPTCTRRKDAWEPKTRIKRSSTVKCKTCGGLGHKKRRCQRAPIASKVYLSCKFFFVLVSKFICWFCF
ncbi:hypothetical protein CFOL_v3_11638 [Cephalotus follicularis]|uniref:CCHC-type domain-containing protein n=1 Tax=Cephalotus follicularis TaxID=3775 RepID=A0A1Q3BJI1_CEPFO|nr:hypothetical protein CFOL_v3_11638 [Cephalotus follicularis]